MSTNSATQVAPDGGQGPSTDADNATAGADQNIAKNKNANANGNNIYNVVNPDNGGNGGGNAPYDWVTYNPNPAAMLNTNDRMMVGLDYQNIDPVVLDLNRDGKINYISAISTLGQHGVWFEMNMDDNLNKQPTEWITPSDGFLVADWNRNGIVDNIREMFGNKKMMQKGFLDGLFGDKKNNSEGVGGFEALKIHDKDRNGKIDEKDPIYKKLKVWQDKDIDGITDKGEMKSLSRIGIASIDLNYTESSKEIFDKTKLFELSSYTTKDGKKGVAGDIMLGVLDGWGQHTLNYSNPLMDALAKITQALHDPKIVGKKDHVAAWNVLSKFGIVGKPKYPVSSRGIAEGDTEIGTGSERPRSGPTGERSQTLANVDTISERGTILA